MSTPHYTDEELQRYFEDRTHRHSRAPNGHGEAPPPAIPPEPPAANGAGPVTSPAHRGYRGFLDRRLRNPKKAEAAFALSILTAFLFV